MTAHVDSVAAILERLARLESVAAEDKSIISVGKAFMPILPILGRSFSEKQGKWLGENLNGLPAFFATKKGAEYLNAFGNFIDLVGKETIQRMMADYFDFINKK